MKKTAFFSEFKKFISKGNIIDMAVGVVIGGAFGKIVTSLVNDIVMPPIGVALKGVNFSDLKVILQEASGDVPAVTLNYGSFIQTVIDFLIVAFCIFCVVRFMIKLQKKLEKKKAEEPVPAPVEPSEEILLLREIRDSLKK